jgi:type IX secretion system PorP/SprF family membrane protein
MKRKITSLFLAFLAASCFAQQDPQFSQNVFNKLATNPAYAGTSQAICATLLGRQQWLGFIDGNKGIPKTYLLSVDATMQKLHGGLGLTVFNDQLGFDKTFSAKLAYSFHIPLGTGILGIGPEVGLLQKSLGGDWVATDDAELDPAIPNVSSMTYDIGFGAFYTNEKLFAGISSTHIPESKLTGEKSYEFVLKRHYYVNVGYEFPLGQSFSLKPSVLVKSDATSTQMDLNIMGVYSNAFWGGLTYRGLNPSEADAVVAMVGFQKEPVGKNGTFKIGYAYDITLSKINNFHVSTHELMLGYCFKLTPPVKKQIHHNVRFL